MQVITNWNPTDCLSARKGRNHNYGILILNQPITDLYTFKRLYEHSLGPVICADGGANRLLDLFGRIHSGSGHADYLPTEVIGDLDSLRPDVESYYKDHGVKFKRDVDQESTDFNKGLRAINTYPVASEKEYYLIVIGGIGGRIDQGLSILHQLHQASLDPTLFPRKIYLFSEESISYVLEKGLNVMYTPVHEGYLKENVGIVPLGGPAVITTQGLEWDVEDWKTEFGHRVSTSNHIKRDGIVIQTSERVLFTVERANRRDLNDRSLVDITNQ